MTEVLSPADLDGPLRRRFSELQTEIGPNWLLIDASDPLEVLQFLKDDPDLDFVYLSGLTAIDRMDRFEVVYHLQSLRHNHLAVVKVSADRADPVVPSVSSLWQGAALQEAEVYDLMGIRFTGHPNLRRIFLWEGFAGWPLRKDFMQVGQGAFNPGLPFFPKEGGDHGVLTGPNWMVPPAGEEGQA